MQREMKYQGNILRVYPDLSTVLGRKQAPFNPVNGVLCVKGVLSHKHNPVYGKALP